MCASRDAGHGHGCGCELLKLDIYCLVQSVYIGSKVGIMWQNRKNNCVSVKFIIVRLRRAIGRFL
ncbi:hypothetical protein AAMO2058_000398500 [Amorphochlora amoebiformis]